MLFHRNPTLTERRLQSLVKSLRTYPVEHRSQSIILSDSISFRRRQAERPDIISALMSS
eukprot:COSAG01_NODE_886_length_12921_cov_115.252652_4_plen_59_part_00